MLIHFSKIQRVLELSTTINNYIESGLNIEKIIELAKSQIQKENLSKHEKEKANELLDESLSLVLELRRKLISN